MNKKHQEIHHFIDTLPQAGHIPIEVRESWIERVTALNDHDPMWHARRLRGIGSSEIGCCVTSARGEFTAFNNARDVALSKLMRLAPDAGTGDTRRGNAMEPVIRGLFHKKFNTRSETSMMADMAHFVVEDAPWMVGNPDDLCFIQDDLYIVDYKCPMPETLQTTQKGEGVKFDYVCQLHHLEHIGKAGNLPIKGRLLCSLDYKAWDLDVRIVAFDQKLLTEMKEVGNELWYDFILQGEAPVMARQPLFEELPDEVLETLRSMAEQFVILRTAGAKAYEMSAAIADEMAEIVKTYRLDGSKILLPGGNIKAKEKIDEEVLEALAQRHGIEVDIKDADSVDRAVEMLEAAGESRTRYIQETPQFAMSRAKMGKDFEMIEACKEEGQKLLLAHAQALAGRFLKDPDADVADEIKEEKSLVSRPM